MSRKYNRDYYPNHDADEFLYSDDLVALNKELLKDTRATPFLISSQVAVETKAYEKRITPLMQQGKISVTVGNTDWNKEYDEGRSYWIPENRWVHETNLKPIEIEKNLYEFRTSADVFFLPASYGYFSKLTNNKYILPFPRPVSRTLYQHLEVDEDILKDLDNSLELEQEDIDNIYSKENPNVFYPYPYFWNVRWLPKNSCKITFYTTEETEKITRVHVPQITLDCLDDIQSLKVPVQLYIDVRKKSPYIKHDELIMYMRVEEI